MRSRRGARNAIRKRASAASTRTWRAKSSNCTRSGVDGGYAQGDVAELARAITGWSVARPADREKRGGDAFVFRAVAHEPGARRVLGKTYAEAGEAQGEAILRDLAVHPATARHLSLKLARHFVADQPPPALVERMAKAYLASGGELAALYRTMVEDDAAWSPTAGKFKSPEDFIVSALRACQLRDDADLALGVRLQGQLGQPVFQPRSPAGFGDVAADWGGPDALFKRVQAAQALAERLPAASAMPLRRQWARRRWVRASMLKPPRPCAAPNPSSRASPCCWPVLRSSGGAEMMKIDRRGFLSLGASAATLSLLPRFALAASSASDTRFLLVLLRGGMDGLHALQPFGDPGFAALRGDFAHADGQPTAASAGCGFRPARATRIHVAAVRRQVAAAGGRGGAAVSSALAFRGAGLRGERHRRQRRQHRLAQPLRGFGAAAARAWRCRR